MTRAFFSASSRLFAKSPRSPITPGAVPGEKRRPASDEIPHDFRVRRPRSFEVRLFLVAALFLAWISVGGAEERENTNPHTTPEDVAAGGRIYRSIASNATVATEREAADRTLREEICATATAMPPWPTPFRPESRAPRCRCSSSTASSSGRLWLSSSPSGGRNPHPLETPLRAPQSFGGRAAA